MKSIKRASVSTRNAYSGFVASMMLPSPYAQTFIPQLLSSCPRKSMYTYVELLLITLLVSYVQMTESVMPEPTQKPTSSMPWNNFSKNLNISITSNAIPTNPPGYKDELYYNSTLTGKDGKRGNRKSRQPRINYIRLANPHSSKRAKVNGKEISSLAASDFAPTNNEYYIVFCTHGINSDFGSISDICYKYVSLINRVAETISSIPDIINFNVLEIDWRSEGKVGADFLSAIVPSRTVGRSIGKVISGIQLPTMHNFGLAHSGGNWLIAGITHYLHFDHVYRLDWPQNVITDTSSIVFEPQDSSVVDSLCCSIIGCSDQQSDYYIDLNTNGETGIQAHIDCMNFGSNYLSGMNADTFTQCKRSVIIGGRPFGYEYGRTLPWSRIYAALTHSAPPYSCGKSMIYNHGY
nr:MAG: hypothetical protein [Halyomorpha halys reo-like associated virus 1]